MQECWQRLGILRYHASSCLNRTLSSIDHHGRRGSSLSDGATCLAVTPNSEQRFTPQSALSYTHRHTQQPAKSIRRRRLKTLRTQMPVSGYLEGLRVGIGREHALFQPGEESWLFVSAEGPETAMFANLGTLMALGALAPLTL